jgi:hypothetical protein
MSQHHYEPVDLQSQEDAHEERVADVGVSQETEDADLKWLMGSRRGRRIVWKLLEDAGVFQDTFHTNALIMARQAGYRLYGMQLLQRINLVCPEMYLKMAIEQKDKTNGRDRRAGAQKPK